MKAFSFWNFQKLEWPSVYGVNMNVYLSSPASDADAGFGRCDAHSSGPRAGAAGISDTTQPSKRGATCASAVEGADGEREAAGPAQPSWMGARGRAFPIAAHAGWKTGLSHLHVF